MKYETMVTLNFTMDQVYRLLRNNKETGPFHFDELIQLSLQPTDLIWIEDKSVGWSHPQEIDIFLLHVTLPVPTSDTRIKPIDPTPSNPVSASIIGQRVFVSMPLEEKTENFIPEVLDAPFSQNHADRLQDQFSNHTIAFDPDEDYAQPKVYSHSLDEIKEEYYQRRFRPPGNKRSLQVVPILLILGIGGLIFAFLQLIKRPSAHAITNKEIYTAALTPHENAGNESDNSAMENHPVISNNRINVTTPDTVSGTVQPSTKSAEASQKVEYIIAVRHKGNHLPSNTVFPNIQNRSTSNSKKAVDEEEQKSMGLENKQSPTLQVIYRKQPPESQQFTLYGMHPDSHGAGVAPFHLTITNNSDELRFAAVDIFYKKNTGDIIGKETLYFRNIAPHKSMTLNAPGNQSADDVIYKLGLVSNEDGEIFYAAGE